MRAYTVATVAVALGVAPKWIDNVLTHHSIPGVNQVRQGVSRRLTKEAVTVLEIALRLSRAFGVPLRIAIEIGSSMTGPSGRYLVDDVELHVDASAIRSNVAERLAEAVEFTPTPRRGRPPKHRHDRA